MAKVLDPARLRWVSWSHFESDECGALNDWLSIAPNAHPVCGMVGALVNVNDFSSRPARIVDTARLGAHRQVSLPLLQHAAVPTWMGCRGNVRRDPEDALLFRYVSPRR